MSEIPLTPTDPLPARRNLEIGPAKQGLIGTDWEGLDCVKRPHVEHVAEWGRDRLPFADGSIYAVYASHVLEHVPWFKVDEALSEVCRILQPGGWFECWVPDFEKLLKIYYSGHIAEDWLPFNEEREPMKWVAGRLFAGMRDVPPENESSSWHRSLFDEAYLRRALEKAGFENVIRVGRQHTGQKVNHEAINLGMRATKPWSDQ